MITVTRMPAVARMLTVLGAAMLMIDVLVITVTHRVLVLAHQDSSISRWNTPRGYKA